MKRHGRFRAFLLTLFCLAAATVSSAHAAWLWDQNADKIDDRIAAVEANGPVAAHLGGVLSGRLRFALMNASAPFEYGVYIGFDRPVTDQDVADLATIGVTTLVRYRSIPYVRAQITAAKALQVAALPHVTRVETIPIMYPTNDIATRVLRARDSGSALFPSVWKNLGVTGKGVTVAILDTGVNDAASGPYPGHESLRGKWVGGGSFFAGQPALNTPLTSSENPAHTADPEVTYHGSHVAGTAIGSGGPNGVLNGAAPGFYAGMAPDARLVDCKVLSDAGLGFGAADALEWLVYHKNDLWGLTGADTVYRGVDVANMSLGGTDNSDGTDASCAAVNAAVRAGIVCCVATGNDGNTHWMASPGAADLALSVGSFTDNNTIPRADDFVSDYSNEGPRLDDGDSDHKDEMKPSVLGSGTGILSVLGDPTTDGTRYHGINGTSMACPTIAGLSALILSANPGLSPSEVRLLLEDTSEHRTDGGKQPPSAADSFGVDPNYHPSWGWGEPDAYAAVKEAQNPQTTQVVRFEATPQRGPDGVRVRWTAQREIGLQKYVVERAPDVYGGPGSWSSIHEEVVALPATSIHKVANRHVYEYSDLDGALVASATYWYRVRWIDALGYSHPEPALPVKIDDSPVVARLLYSWTHNYSDGDLAIRVGTGTSTSSPVWFRPGLGAPAADSVVTRPGISFTGTLQHYFHVDLTEDDLVRGYLPPSAANPWFLSVKEGGYVNTNGRVESFAMQVFGPGGTTTYTALNPPTPTVEKTETIFWLPLDPATTVNHSPVIQAVAPQSMPEGIHRMFTVFASDPDGQTLTYSAIGLPAGATFDAGQRRFDWTPTYAQAGQYSVKFVVSDGAFPVAATDTETVAIAVVDRAPGSNLAPTFDPLPDQAGFVGVPITFKIRARDPEEAALAYSALAIPPGSTLDSGTGTFSWTPNAIGRMPLTFVVTDPGGLADTLETAVVSSSMAEGPPPPSACVESAQEIQGVVGMGVNGTNSDVKYFPFVVPPNTQRLEASLVWALGPVVDLDFYLLDEDSNVVAQGASTDATEHFVVNTLEAGHYIWQVIAFTNPDTANFDLDWSTCATPVVGVGDVALGVSFAPAAPNPFVSFTRMSFALPHPGRVTLKLYDVAGRLVRTLEDGELPAGTHAVRWDRRSDAGTAVRSGVYFARLQFEDKSLGQKLVLVH
jgi:hypothetical protein